MAAERLVFNENDSSWLKNLEQIQGTFLKRDLISRKTGLLQVNEKDYLYLLHRDAYESYDRLCKRIRERDPSLMKDLFTEIQAVSEKLHEPEQLVSELNTRRARIVFPSSKAKKKIARATKIETLITNLEFETYVMHFNPCELWRAKPFYIPSVIDQKEWAPTDEEFSKVTTDFGRWLSRQVLTESQVRLCENWFQTDVRNRFFAC
jgi:hypothetical protein